MSHATSPSDTPITLGALLKWGGWVVGIAGALILVGAGYVRVDNRITAVEAASEGVSGTARRIRRVEKMVATLVCAQMPGSRECREAIDAIESQQ